MATKTNNLGLSKAELTDSVRNTLTANNENFDKIDDHIARLKANQITGTASGTEIVVEDSAEMESKLKISGNSEQDSRSGKNLFDYKTVNNGNAYSTSDKEGWITTSYDNSSGASALYGQYFTDNLKLKTSTQYALFVEIKEISGNPSCEFASVHVTSQNATNTYSKNLSAGIYKYLITTVDSFTNATNGIRTVISIGAGANVSIKYRISVLEDTSIGAEDFAYEPYGAMPSPDYPSEIRSVSGDVEVKVEGKNLFDKDNFETLHLGIDNNTKIFYNASTFNSFYIKCKSNTTYTVSKISSKRFTIATCMDIPIADGVATNSVGKDNGTQLTITSGINDKYLWVYYYKSDTDTLTEQEILDTIQIEEGSTATAYEPYKAKTISLPLGDIELRSTPDGTRDTFERVDGVWNKVENVGIAVFDGSDDENWKIQYGTGLFNLDYSQSLQYSTNDAMCSHFVFNKITEGMNAGLKDGEFAFQPQFNGKPIFVKNLAFDNVTDWITWLSTHPIEVVYQSTQTYTPITDPVLIQALDELEQLILHKGYNRITVTSVNGVKAYLDLSYIKDINSVLDNINAIILTLGGGANV